MKPALMPFKMPKTYHRAFYLEVGSTRHLMEFKGRKCYMGYMGNIHTLSTRETSSVLDWIEETMMRVMMEFDA